MNQFLKGDRIMKSIITRITLFFVFISFLTSLPAYSATERRTALVIGNGSYEVGPLRNPANDATDVAATLRRLGFHVILKKNVGYQEMEEAVGADRVVALERGTEAYAGAVGGLFSDIALVRRLGLGLPPAGELALALAELGRGLRGLPLTMDELLAALGGAP